MLALTAGTYDVQRLILTECAQPNCIKVRVTFSLHSRGRGTLVILLPQGEGTRGRLDVTRAIFLVLRRSITDAASCKVLSVPSGKYLALAYDVEWDGTIHSETPATRGVVSVVKESPANGKCRRQMGCQAELVVCFYYFSCLKRPRYKIWYFCPLVCFFFYEMGVV